MDVFLTILITSLKVFSGLLLASSIFRLPIRSYLVEYIGLAIFVSFLLKSLIYLNLGLLFINILFFLMLFLFYRFAIKVSVWHTFLVVSVGFLLSEVLEILFGLPYIAYTKSVFSQMSLFERALIFQSLKLVLVIGFVMVLQKFRIGFVFASEKMCNKPRSKKLSRILIMIAILAYATIFVTFITENDENFYLVLVVFYLLSIIYTYKISRESYKEVEEKFDSFVR